MLGGKLFVIKFTSACSSVGQLKKNDQYVFLYLLDVIRGVIRMTRQNEFQEGEKSSSKLIIDLSIRLRSRLDMKVCGSFYRHLARGG